MAKSLLEVIKGDSPVFFINALCGLGDVVSHLTRLPAVKKKYPNHVIVFLLGGFGASPRLMKEMIERQGEIALIIKNYTWHSQHDKMEEFIKKTYVKESRGDVYETWSFCKEIFSNQEPSFMQYEMAFPYTYNSSTPQMLEGFSDFVNAKTVVIKPFTTEGNAEGFEHDVENNRFWSTEKWVCLIERLKSDGFFPIFIGLKKDLQDLPEQCQKKNIDFLDFTDRSIEETILIINNSNGCITTNSWEWQIAARCGLPTICVYLKNHFFLPVHVSQGPSPIWDNLYIETDTFNQEPESAYHIASVFKFLTEYKKRPDENYSIAMITYNDVDCIEETLKNVTPYIKNDFVVVDGGSTDGTLEILKSHKDITLLEKKWQDNFEIQKNFALDATTQEWRLLIDADEQYEHLFWNQLPWHIVQAEVNASNCVSVPRINIVDGLTKEMVEENGWILSHFNWINYPDYQQRLYKRSCKYVGQTHELIVGDKNPTGIMGQHIIHRKTLARQERGLKREHDQYVLAAKDAKQKLDVKSNIVVHCVESLADDDRVKKLEDNIQFLVNNKDGFSHVLATPAHSDLTKEKEFVNLLGDDNIIRFASLPELLYILDAVKPYIVHMQTDINVEDIIEKAIKKNTEHFIGKHLDGGPEDNLNFYKAIG